MNEAAEAKLDSLIIESQSQSEEAPKLFPLDKPDRVVSIEVIYDDDDTLELFHRIKWPELDALKAREQQISEKVETLSPNRKKIHRADIVAANALLWDKYRLQVKGYGSPGADADQWVDVTPDIAAEIPPEHKSTAMVELFASEFKVERLEGKVFVLGAQEYRVRQTYGDYTIHHVFGKHQEGDRREIIRKSVDTQYQTGASKVTAISFTNLKPFIQFYDKFFLRLEGVAGADPNIAQRKDLVSAIWKQGAVDALMSFFEASRRDLKKN